MSVEQYLEKVGAFVDNDYGRIVRKQFQDIGGASELAMLASPTRDELRQLRKAVAIMTDSEKKNAHSLSDDQILTIADDAGIDPANLAIFLNGYAINARKA